MCRANRYSGAALPPEGASQGALKNTCEFHTIVPERGPVRIGKNKASLIKAIRKGPPEQLQNRNNYVEFSSTDLMSLRNRCVYDVSSKGDRFAVRSCETLNPLPTTSLSRLPFRVIFNFLFPKKLCFNRAQIKLILFARRKGS